MKSDRTLPRLPHVVIENVSPELDGGRHPIKRSAGDAVHVTADIYKDGHDLISARVLYRPAGETTWRKAPMRYEFNPDRWFASFTPDRLGRWEYTIEAWPAHYRSWRADLEKRLSVGQDVTSELLEGTDLLRRAARGLESDEAARLKTLAGRLGDPGLSLDDRLQLAFSEEVLELVHGPIREEEATRYDRVLGLVVDRDLARFGAWYELFPRSQSSSPDVHGTFADVERRLPELAALGFDVLYLPPIHPIGHTHRKGKDNATVAQPGDVGSPWAIGSEEGGHLAIHPELGTLEQFRALVHAAREFGMEISLDYALQCSPDHPWVKEHPEWYFIRPDGSVRYAENPPKKYEDIYPLNFWCEDRQGLWNACRDIFLYWIKQGVRVFRVDNPHTKPLAFWEWVIGEVQKQHPEAVFLAEAFTRPNRMKGIAKLGFSQSYTYFTWKNTSWELRDYLTELSSSGMTEYYRPNFFANTPDILHEYLQTGGRPAFRIRLLLAGTLSPSYGIYSGFELCENTPAHHGSEEYLHSEKYEIRVRDWNAPGNIKQDVARLNRIRRENPALHRIDNLTFVESSNDAILAYVKRAPEGDLLIAVNLDPHHAQETMLQLPAEIGIGADESYDVEDLLGGHRYGWRGTENYVRLDPSERVGHIFKLLRPAISYRLRHVRRQALVPGRDLLRVARPFVLRQRRRRRGGFAGADPEAGLPQRRRSRIRRRPGRGLRLAHAHRGVSQLPRVRRHRLLPGGPALRLQRGLQGVDARGPRPWDPDPRGPGRQPHLRRASLVPGCGARPRLPLPRLVSVGRRSGSRQRMGRQQLASLSGW